MRDVVKIISLFGKSSYHEKFPSISLIHEEDLFLECRCHDVCLPIKSYSAAKLNLFEETVLRLLGTYGKSVEEISELSCLELDFVKVICSGLRQSGFIGENNTLTAAGKDYLSNGSESENVEEKFIRVLTLADTGRLLAPVLQSDNFDCDGFFYGGGLSMSVDSRDKGKEVPVTGSFIDVPKDKRNRTRKIYSHDVKKIIADYNRNNDKKIRQANFAMSISQSGSRVFLHVKCAVQRGFVEQLIVSDGTQIISGDLVQYLTEHHGDYVDDFWKRATTSRQEVSTEKTSSDHGKYYKVTQNLDELESFTAGTDRDTIQQNSKRERDNYNRLLAAVQYALNYSLQERPISREHKEILYSQTPAENFRTLACFAQQLKLKVAGSENLLSRVNAMSFKRYQQSEVPDLSFVLPLVIVGSVEDKSSPFAKLAKETPNLLELFTKLNRPNFRHGSEEEIFLPEDYLQIERETKNFIAALLPDFNYNGAPKETSDFVENISQERLNATVALKEVLGSKIFYEAGENLRETLIRLSPHYTGEKMLSPMDFVNSLYMCLENFIRIKAENFSLPTKNLPDVLSRLEKLVGAPLPRSLKYVSKRMFDNAAEGRNASLGAYALVLLGAVPREFLADKQSVTKIFATLDEIISLRQHANNVELNLTLTEKDLNSLREKTFDVLKRMEEF